MYDNVQSIAYQGSSPKIPCSEFLLGFPYIGMIKLLTLQLDLHPSHIFLPRGQADYHMYKRPNSLVMWLVFLPSLILSRLFKVNCMEAYH